MLQGWCNAGILAGLVFAIGNLPQEARSEEGPGSGADPAFRIVLPAEALQGGEAPFLTGERAAVETFLKEDRLGRSAFSPIDAFNSLIVAFRPPLVLMEAVDRPARIEKTYSGASGITARSTWQADGERPFFRVDYEIRNGSQAEVPVTVSVKLAANVGYINKFVPHPDDLGRVDGKTLVFTDRAFPRLSVAMEMDPAPDRVILDPVGAIKPGAQSGTFEADLRIPSGEARRLAIVVKGSDDPAELAAIGTGAQIRSFLHLLNGAASLETPEPLLDEFFRASRIWPAGNVRRLPFGPPYGLDGTANRPWPVITASPDYHGIFANDCIQSLWELGLLGPGLYPASRNSVETMLRFGPKESVEWWTGDGKVWMFPLPLGDTPQIALGAAWHLLWTGDRALARAWWPDIQRLLSVLDANDSDRDSLEDRPNTPYPEQPDPGQFNHEMLYVQCFWRQAFRKASDVAAWLGLPEAEDLRRKSERISAAIEERFGTPYGLAVWLDRNHAPHPHIGHEQIIAAAAGDVGDATALRIVGTMTRPPVWTADGPLRAEPGKGVAAGDHVWTFMRWKLVLALFRLGKTDQALELALRWAAQEKGLLYQAPEGFPTVTGTTGKAYTWTAGRAMRALAFGLSGLDLEGRGIRFAPRLPSAWSGFALLSLAVHGTRIDLQVRRGPAEVLVNGMPRPAAEIAWEELRSGPLTVRISIP